VEAGMAGGMVVGMAVGVAGTTGVKGVVYKILRGEAAASPLFLCTPSMVEN
jgi:hypothetical protein